MEEFTYTVKDPLGIHARPGGMIARIAKKYEGTAIRITKDDKAALANQLIKLISLGVRNGDTVTVSVEGDDEKAAISELKTFFETNL